MNRRDLFKTIIGAAVVAKTPLPLSKPLTIDEVRNQEWESVAWDASKNSFVALGSNSEFMTSSDGVNWSRWEGVKEYWQTEERFLVETTSLGDKFRTYK